SGCAHDFTDLVSESERHTACNLSRQTNTRVTKLRSVLVNSISKAVHEGENGLHGRFDDLKRVLTDTLDEGNDNIRRCRDHLVEVVCNGLKEGHHQSSASFSVLRNPRSKLG